MPKIKVGQIGTAHGHAADKLKTFRASDEYEVVGIVEPDPQLKRLAEGQAAFRDLPWMTVEQLLNVPDLKAVAIETEPNQLLANAEVCVKAGKHVHIDKPAGESLPHFRRILDEAARKHLCVQMGYMYRYNPAVIIMRDLLRKGFLGEVFEIHCAMSKVVETPARLKFAPYPGGMMFELGCHMIDVIVDLIGQPQTVTPYATHTGVQEDGLKDNMLAVFGYPKAIASVRSSALEVDGFSRRHFVLCGTKGTVHIQPMDAPKILKLTLAKEQGKYQQGYQEIPLEPFKRYVADVADLAKIIRGEKAADFSIMHDLAVQETVLRASGCPIDV